MDKKISILTIVITISLLFTFNAAKLKAYDNEKQFVANRLVVKMSHAAGAASKTFAGNPWKIAKEKHPPGDLLFKYKTEIKRIQPHRIKNYYIVETSEGCDIEALGAKLRRDPAVLDASPDYYAVIASVVPDDPYLQYQYALVNIGQVYFPGTGQSGTPGSDIKATEGWEWTTGSEDVIVAVIDSGVAGDHEDLVGKTVPGYNFVADNDDAYDDHGHGTLVASIIAANTDNGVGVAGVSWHSKIMPIKTMASSGYGSYLAIAAGIRYAADNGAHVINLSVGGSAASFILEEACQYAFDSGAVLVVSAGNTHSSVHYPAAYDDYCIAVAATDANDERTTWSNYGPQIDVAAPGAYIWGAKIYPNDPDNLDSYNWGSGTSYAAPLVAGAAALLIAQKPFLLNSQVMSLIKYTADDVNAEAYPGIDDYLGYGRLNLRTLLGPFEL